MSAFHPLQTFALGRICLGIALEMRHTAVGANHMFKPIALATLVSGTLDLAFAMILTLAFGRQVDVMLRYVASGPFPAATDMGFGGAILGLFVHFALMAAMAAGFMWLTQLRPGLLRTPYRTGLAYGVLTYFVMNWAAVPVRFGTPLPPKPLSIGTQLFAHIVLVGIPFALIAVRYLRRSSNGS